PACAPGAQTLQRMTGCDLLADGSIRGYDQHAIDGRDFIAFDWATKTFTAADAAAVVTKRDWEKDETEAERIEGYVEETCTEFLKKYLSYGQAELERKESPEVRVWGREGQGSLTLWCRAS
ncbi:HA1F protein, partial [Psilopogon haemacephalus]|nr:HA1F protein [Psilopogon haemacephalus]